MIEERALVQKLEGIQRSEAGVRSELNQFFELANSAYLSYISAKAPDRRDLVKSVISNISWDGKNVSFKLKKPFQIVVERPPYLVGCPYRGGMRTLSALVTQVFEIIVKGRKERPEEIGLEP